MGVAFSSRILRTCAPESPIDYTKRLEEISVEALMSYFGSVYQQLLKITRQNNLLVMMVQYFKAHRDQFNGHPGAIQRYSGAPKSFLSTTKKPVLHCNQHAAALLSSSG